VRDQTIGEFLGQLAARIPAPGGGATAALHAAQSAALLAMVARYSDGPRYDSALMDHVVREADPLREEALRLAEDDATAFGLVAEAYRAPRQTDEERAVRSALIASALVEAARPPAAVIGVALRLIGLAEELLPSANRNVITDVAAAAEAARAAAVTAQVNVEVNMRGIKDPEVAAGLGTTASEVGDIVARADAVVAAVRAEIGQ
jgi:formiminotetrahydrofolate cyclodeaminase